jgi:all-trans-retinol 13,14-reductase
MSFDAIVVGAGLGGLAAAATLAKHGRRVHVIEPHDKVGGFATNFRRRKYRMEAGIHMLPGSFPGSQSQEVLQFLEINEHIQFTPIPDFYHCYFQGERVCMPHQMELAKEQLKKRFPQEIVGIDHFFSTMLEINNEFSIFSTRQPFISATHPMFKAIFPRFEKYWNMSLGNFLDRIISNHLLKATLLANVGFYHHNHYELSLVIFMISQSGYYLGGCYYIQGGSQTLSDYLRGVIEKNGGKITLNHQVEKMDVENNQVRRVHYRKVRGDNPQLQMSEAKQVIINAPMPLVRQWIAGSENFEKWGTSTSSTTLYFGLRHSFTDLGNESYLNIFIDEKAKDEKLIVPGHLAVLNYDSIDARLCAEGVHTCEVMYMDNIKSWQDLDPEQYLKRKTQVQNEITAKLENYYPGFASDIEFCEVGTPKTVVRYTNSPNGAIYGFNPSAESFRQRSQCLHLYSGAQDTQLDNVFYASGWSYMPGFSGVLISGYKAAIQALAAL